jgi:hypothetical protein
MAMTRSYARVMWSWPPRTLLLVAALLSACTPRRSSISPSPLAADQATSREVAPGVVHRRLVINRGPWVLQVVEVDLRRPELELRAEHAFGTLLGREKTSAIAKRIAGDSLDVLAAVNADFFVLSTGEAINNQVVEGRLITGVGRADATRAPRSQFALTRDRRPLIERFVMAGFVVVGRDTFPLAGVNTPPPPDAIVLRTHPAPDTLPRDTVGDVRALGIFLERDWGDSSTFMSAGALSVASVARVPRGGALLVARGRASQELEATLDNLRDEARVRVVAAHRLEPARGSLRTLVGGWPRLVVEGVSVGDSTSWHEGASRSFITTRHPRTGIGFSRDSTMLYLVAVDGRQQQSAGMTIAEFAETMQALGAYQAVNLDGGGSTTVVIRDSVVNSPSDPTGERAVGNALVLVKRIR